MLWHIETLKKIRYRLVFVDSLFAWVSPDILQYRRLRCRTAFTHLYPFMIFFSSIIALAID